MYTKSRFTDAIGKGHVNTLFSAYICELKNLKQQIYCKVF
jgi:hypothetical protein